MRPGPGPCARAVVASVGVEFYSPFAGFEEWSKGVALQARTWDDFLASFDEARSSVPPEVLEEALGSTIRTAALETGAIEGLYGSDRGITRLVADEVAGWEASLSELGRDVRAHFNDHLLAIELVLDAVTHSLPVTEAFIRRLHEVACAHQDTVEVHTSIGVRQVRLYHGAYKTQPNNVTLADGSRHEYAPVSEVPVEMERLVDQLESPEFSEAHPVLQAAYAHHVLTSVHPFADGNGRVARLLASIFTIRAVRIPLVIFADQRVRYWDALAQADEERPQRFVTFVEDRLLDGLALITGRLQQAVTSLESEADALRELLVGHEGLSVTVVAESAQRVAASLKPQIEALIDERVSDGTLPSDVNTSVEDFSTPSCDFGQRNYRVVSGWPQGARASLWIQEPVHASAEFTLVVGIANDIHERYAFIITDANRPGDEPLTLRVSDVYPAVQTAASRLVGNFVDNRMTAALRDLRSSLDQHLRSDGFR